MNRDAQDDDSLEPSGPPEPTGSLEPGEPLRPFEPQHGWLRKFTVALAGIYQGARGQSSFLVHSLCGAAALVASALLRISLVEWCLILLCITMMLACELFNSAIEQLAHAVDRNYNRQLGVALDIAAGAVLVVALGSATIGVLVFGRALWELLRG